MNTTEERTMSSDVTEIEHRINDYGRRARAAARTLATAPTASKNAALHAAASLLRQRTGAILDANRRDVDRARADGRADAFIDRLLLTD